MTEITEVPSPFCGVGTDDLTVSVDGLTVKVTENGCSVNTPLFEQPIVDTSPRISGQTATMQEAVAKACEILQNSLAPCYSGCATDVNGMRALLALADHNGAVVDQMRFSSFRNNCLTMQDSGWMTTTLAEVKNRCDLLLVVGTDLETFAPRFLERYIDTPDRMFVAPETATKIVYLGKPVTTQREGSRAITCENADLPEILATLKALINDRPLQIDSVAGISLSELAALAEELKAASYSVVTWAASEFDMPQADLSVQMLCELVKDLNVDTRSSGLPLGGKQGDLSASQVAGWITGYPARISYAKGFPQYDPYLYDHRALLVEGTADSLLWVQAYDQTATPPQCDVPLIVLGRSGMQFDREPDVYIPIGTPGIDHVGHVFRMDSVVPLRLKKLRDSGLPSTAEVLSAIEQAMQV